MTKFLYTLLCVVLAYSLSTAQEEMLETTELSITDEMTVDSEQNSKWRKGEYGYSAKPKHSWELGVHLGHFFIDGDVDRTIPGGFGVGLHLRKAIHYAFSLRGDFFYGRATGLDPQPSGSNLLPEQSVFGGYGPENPWFFNHRTTYGYVAMQGVINIGNLLFHSPSNKWNWYATVGVGLDSHSTKLDLRDENGNLYTDLVSRSGFTSSKFDTKSGRAEIKDALNNIYDGDYETDGFKKKGIFRLGDDTNIHVVFTTSMGVARKITKRINLGLEHQVMLTDNDYLDGQKWRTNLDQTNNADIMHYTNLRLAINLGNFDNVTEPLYWLNPLDRSFNDIASLKQRPQLDLSDEDGDGIIDMLDQELDTPAGCAVDTRGVVLDSDGDGLADCKDTEPYSPPGYDVDNNGVASIPAVETLSESDVIRIMNANCPGCKKVETGCGEWFLPMIHFDLDKYSIKPEYYSQLHHVASVMKMCPEICVTVQGHTDTRNTNDYNTTLSYNRAKSAVDFLVANYGIDRGRLKLMYGGEDSPLGGASSAHYMNRRVEFRLCSAGDFDMARPEGATYNNVINTGSISNGNKNSGY